MFLSAKISSPRGFGKMTRALQLRSCPTCTFKMASRVAHHSEDGLPVDVSVIRITPIYYRHEVQPLGKGKLLPNPKGTYEKNMVMNHVSHSSWEPILQENGVGGVCFQCNSIRANEF